MIERPLRRRLAAAAATVASLALLAGCGAGSAGQAASGAGTGSTYVFAVPQDFQGVDRAKYSSEASKTIGDIMHSRLLEIDTTGYEPGSCVAAVPPKIAASSPLIDSWSVTPNGLGIAVTLKQGVTSAAGNPLTSADVAWSIERIKAIDASAQTLWFSVGGFDKANTITVESPTRFTLNLTKPTELAPFVLANNAGLILDSTAAKQHATATDPWASGYLTDHTADFGPWTLQQFSSQQLTFAPNPHYAGERGNLGRIVVRTVPDASARMQLLQTGQAAETNGLDYAQLEQLKNSGSVRIDSCPNPARDWLGLNESDPVLGKAEVRAAISLALDRKALSTAVYHGFADPATGGLAAAYDAGGDAAPYTRDLDRARQLLAQAGVPAGFAFDLSVSDAQPGPYSGTLAVLIQQQLAEVGITVKVRNVPSAVQFRDDGRAKRMQAFLMAETPAFGNAGYSAWLTAGSSGLQNYTGYSNPRLDELTAQLQAGTAPDATSAATELAGIIAADQPAIYLVDRKQLAIRNTCATAVPSTPFGNDYTQATATCGKP